MPVRQLASSANLGVVRDFVATFFEFGVPDRLDASNKLCF
jgi:hypothetical protein